MNDDCVYIVEVSSWGITEQRVTLGKRVPYLRFTASTLCGKGLELVINDIDLTGVTGGVVAVFDDGVFTSTLDDDVGMLSAVRVRFGELSDEQKAVINTAMIARKSWEI